MSIRHKTTSRAPKVESGVPLMSAAYQSWPLNTMNVGDSFLVTSHFAIRLPPTISWHGKRTGKKFALRVLEEGVRVWRTK